MHASSSDQRTTVVTVSYRSGEHLKKMLSSLPPATPTVIVNNDPEDRLDLVEGVQSTENIDLIDNETNTGFGSACNTGANQTNKEFILFLNPDARLKPGCIAVLEKTADTFPNAVALNPAMADESGKPLFKRSSVLLPRHTYLPRGWPAETTNVPVLNGAALFVRKSAFEQVGGFDQKIFLYHEDDDLSIRLAQQVGDLMFVRDAEVIHQSGHSTARTAETAALKAYHLGWSRIYATRKHNIPMARSKATASALFQLLNPVVLLSSRKRAKQVAFFKGILSAIFEGSKP